MDKKALDPAGHLTLAASDLKRSKKFYKDLFGHLGFRQIRNTEHSAAWVTREGFGIWLKQAKSRKPPYKYFAPGLQHLCLKAQTRKTVDGIYIFLSSKKVSILHKPRPYPKNTPKYYAVFLADPDGMKIEIAYY